MMKKKLGKGGETKKTKERRGGTDDNNGYERVAEGESGQWGALTGQDEGGGVRGEGCDGRGLSGDCEVLVECKLLPHAHAHAQDETGAAHNCRALPHELR